MDFNMYSEKLIGKEKANALMDIVTKWIFVDYLQRSYTDLVLCLTSRNRRPSSSFVSFRDENVNQQLDNVLRYHAVASNIAALSAIERDTFEDPSDYFHMAERNFSTAGKGHTLFLMTYVAKKYCLTTVILINDDEEYQTVTFRLRALINVFVSWLEMPTNIGHFAYATPGYILCRDNEKEDIYACRFTDRAFENFVFPSMRELQRVQLAESAEKAKCQPP